MTTVVCENTVGPVKHTIRWYVYQDRYDYTARYLGRELIPRESFHKPSGGWTGYEAKCSCGWETRTGGAIVACIKREINEHLWDVDWERMLERSRAQADRRQAKLDAMRQRWTYRNDQYEAELTAIENGYRFSRLERR